MTALPEPVAPIPLREVGLSEVNRVGIAPDALGTPMLCFQGNRKTLQLLSGLPGAQRWPEWDCLALPLSRETILVAETVGRIEEATDDYIAARSRFLAAPRQWADNYPPAPPGEPEPLQHQIDTFCTALDAFERGFGGFGIWNEQGTGKTRLACDLLRVLMQQCAVVVVQNSTALQWKDWLARICPGCEVRMLTGIPLKDRAALIREVASADWPGLTPVVFVVNWEAIARLQPELVRLRPEVVIADECFLADTPVDTPGGARPIQSLRVGDAVYSAAGEDYVVATSNRTVSSLVKVCYKQREFICSKDHLWLTTDGWVRACRLKEGDQLVERHTSLRNLRESNGTRAMGENESSKATVLQPQLLREMANAATHHQGKNLYACPQRETLLGRVKLVRQSLRGGGNGSTTSQNDAFVSHTGIQETSSRNAEENRAQTSHPRRKWARAYRCTTVSTGSPWRRMATGVDCAYQSWQTWLSRSLQDRHRQSRSDDSHRGRWPQSSLPTSPRREEGRQASGVRVDGVEIYERGSAEFIRYSYGQDHVTLYDIQVARHPSFCVHGVVVHNCTRAKERTAQMSKALHKIGEAATYRIAMTGTPLGNDPGDLWSIYRYLEPALFGKSYWGFVNTFFLLGGWSGNEFIGFNPLQIGRFIGLMYASAFRITKSTLMEMPEKNYETVTLEMTGEQAKLYRQVEDDLYASRIREDGTVEKLSVANALVQMCRLQQISAGLFPVDNETGERARCVPIQSVKTQWLKEYCREAIASTDTQLIVWARFTAEIEAICRALSEAGLEENADFAFINGSVKNQARRDYQVRFNDRENPLRILVCQLQAVALGFDLPSCDVMLYHSASFSLIERLQSVERGHRMGRTRPYSIIDLVCRGSVDGDILQALKRKQNLSEMLLIQGLSNDGNPI